MKQRMTNYQRGILEILNVKLKNEIDDWLLEGMAEPMRTL
uniref:Uncharacterized protein n=1 Tax=Moniliophthora roreri TaxID=221103 RepID=A0A0W0FHX8_MONRR